MRMPPDFLPYPEAFPPNNMRWLAFTVAILFIGETLVALISPAEQRLLNSLVITGTLCLSVLFAWTARVLRYRCAQHNAHFYYQLVEYELQQWWLKHRQAVMLQDVVLLGPCGKDPQHWRKLLAREHHKLQPVEENGRTSLRLQQVYGNSQAEREGQLARLLVMQWREAHPDTLQQVPQQFYWQGSHQAWQAFRQQAAATFPELVVPETPQRWQGEHSLANVIETMAQAAEGACVLIAGCQSNALVPLNKPPAGEAALLWLAGREGQVQLCRGEKCDLADAAGLVAACQRSLQQSEIDAPPATCLLFSLPEHDLSSLSGWNLTHHLQDQYWGRVGELEALIVMSLAAINAQQQGEPSGWIATDPTGGYTTGIVKPYG